MDNYRITDTEIKENSVDSQPHHLSGDAEKIQKIFDALPTLIANKFNDFVTAVGNKFKSYYTIDETEDRITATMEAIGAGDMAKAEYAVAEEPGTVKNAKQFDGHNVEEFMAKANFEFDAETQTLNIIL